MMTVNVLLREKAFHSVVGLVFCLVHMYVGSDMSLLFFFQDILVAGLIPSFLTSRLQCRSRERHMKSVGHIVTQIILLWLSKR